MRSRIGSVKGDGLEEAGLDDAGLEKVGLTPPSDLVYQAPTSITSSDARGTNAAGCVLSDPWLG